MFLRILKNDLVRRKVTNAILLIFIALAAMFVSGSVNTIVTIVTAQDDFYDMAGMGDVFIILRESVPGDDIMRVARHSEKVESYIREPLLYSSKEQMESDTASTDKIVSMVCLAKVEGSGIKYFTDGDLPLGKINSGEIYVPYKATSSGALSIGDRLKITVGGQSVDVTVKGIVKDALLGSPFVGGNRFLLSEEDFDRLYASDGAEPYMGALYSFSSEDPSGLMSELSETSAVFLINATRSQLKMSNVMDIIVAAMYLAVSVCLILISFVVLNFTIKFTLDQEFREIGVMKAIGIPDKSTERLYMAKYLFISAVGALAGFAAGIPFGNYMLRNAAVNIVIQSRDPYGINLACAALVMASVMLFCGKCVRSVRKYTPVDAVRSGNNGETYSKKSPLSLQKTALRPVSFLAVNDVLTNLKTFAVMAFTFTVSLMLIIVVVDTINTLRSGNIVTMMSMAPSDLYMSRSDELFMDYTNENGREILTGRLEDVRKKLEENGMDAETFAEVALHATLTANDRVINTRTWQGVGTTADMYTYLSGSAPQNTDEIAVTPNIAEALGADIGDYVTVTTAEGDRRVMITATFQSMMDIGSGVRIYEGTGVDFSQLSGGMAIQIKFNDSPDSKELARRAEIIRRLYPDYEVLDGGEYIDKLIGVAAILEKVRIILVPLLIIVCMLVTVLMERSLIAKEKSETAMLKAAGFSDGFVIRRDMLRVIITTVFSTLIAIPLSTPFAQITSGWGFRIMGARSIAFDIHPLEAFVFYPAALLAFTLCAVWLTAQTTRKIRADQTASIE